jgi:hypothetical protein
MAGTSLSARRDYGHTGARFPPSGKEDLPRTDIRSDEERGTALEFIEAEEFQKLPGGIYNTSYIRQYAKAIDSDESEILAVYYSVMGINPRAEEKPERKPVPRPVL